MNDNQPAIGRFGWITLAAATTAIAAIVSYAFTVAMDAPMQRLNDLKSELYREIDSIKNARARMIARDDIFEARMSDHIEMLDEMRHRVTVNTNARLKGGRFTEADGIRLEKMLILIERRIERIEDRIYPPLYRPQILEDTNND